MTNPQEVTILAHDPGRLTIGHLNCVLIAHWSATPTVKHVAALHGSIQTIVTAHGQVASLHIVQGDMSIPSVEARDALTKLSHCFHTHVLALSYAVQFQGFLASVVRSVVTGVLMAVPTPYPVGVHMHTDEATGWLSETLTKHPKAPNFEPATLEQAVAQAAAYRGPAQQPQEQAAAQRRRSPGAGTR